MLGLAETARLLGGTLDGADVHYRGCATDTRTLEPGALFVALAGEHHHGHEFLSQARARGAAAALVEQSGLGELPSVVVADTRRALGDLAAAWRARFAAPVVGITGSNGKTTVKEMLAAILGQQGQVLATRGNLNNDIGLPLTLGRLGPEHRLAVLEMGANHPGEIARLTRIARPTVGVITQCAPAHLQGFGSVQGVARAKGELIAGLAPEAVAVINAEDPFAGLWAELAGSRRCLRFAIDAPAQVSARWEPAGTGARMELRTPVGSRELNLPLPGRHNVMNALAAAAAALALEVPLALIASGLERAGAVQGRLELVAGRAGARILDDTYNANPTSLAAALQVLAELGGRRWLVLGDMAELGEQGPRYHREAGEQARGAGVERLEAVGELSAQAVRGFGAGATHHRDLEALIASLRQGLGPGVTVLVKGSRSARMERVVEALRQEDA